MTAPTKTPPRLSAAAAEVRRARFLPFVQPWCETDPAPRALDLDCGAGGWMQLLSMAGFAVQGCESDPELRKAARAAGFSVDAEGAACLSGLPDGALSVLTGFEMLTRHDPHAIETLLPGMLRVLRPGGILILGGVDADHPSVVEHARETGTRAENLAGRLGAEDPGRLCVVRDGGLPGGPFGLDPQVAIVWQRNARGPAFDQFHAAFAEAACFSPPDSLRPSLCDAYLLDRQGQTEGRVAHLEAVHAATRTAMEERTLRLERRVTELEARYAVQTGELAAHRREIETLRHLTRRRGLRKWLHDRRSPKTQEPEPDMETDAPAPPDPSPLPSSPPPARTLSTRMQAIRKRLVE